MKKSIFIISLLIICILIIIPSVSFAQTDTSTQPRDILILNHSMGGQSLSSYFFGIKGAFLDNDDSPNWDYIDQDENGGQFFYDGPEYSLLVDFDEEGYEKRETVKGIYNYRVNRMIPIGELTENGDEDSQSLRMRNIFITETTDSDHDGNPDGLGLINGEDGEYEAMMIAHSQGGPRAAAYAIDQRVFRSAEYYNGRFLGVWSSSMNNWDKSPTVRGIITVDSMLNGGAYMIKGLESGRIEEFVGLGCVSAILGGIAISYTLLLDAYLTNYIQFQLGKLIWPDGLTWPFISEMITFGLLPTLTATFITVKSMVNSQLENPEGEPHKGVSDIAPGSVFFNKYFGGELHTTSIVYVVQEPYDLDGDGVIEEGEYIETYYTTIPSDELNEDVITDFEEYANHFEEAQELSDNFSEIASLSGIEEIGTVSDWARNIFMFPTEEDIVMSKDDNYDMIIPNNLSPYTRHRLEELYNEYEYSKLNEIIEHYDDITQDSDGNTYYDSDFYRNLATFNNYYNNVIERATEIHSELNSENGLHFSVDMVKRLSGITSELNTCIGNFKTELSNIFPYNVNLNSLENLTKKVVLYDSSKIIPPDDDIVWDPPNPEYYPPIQIITAGIEVPDDEEMFYQKVSRLHRIFTKISENDVIEFIEFIENEIEPESNLFKIKGYIDAIYNSFSSGGTISYEAGRPLRDVYYATISGGINNPIMNAGAVGYGLLLGAFGLIETGLIFSEIFYIIRLPIDPTNAAYWTGFVLTTAALVPMSIFVWQLTYGLYGKEGWWAKDVMDGWPSDGIVTAENAQYPVDIVGGTRLTDDLEEIPGVDTQMAHFHYPEACHGLNDNCAVLENERVIRRIGELLYDYRRLMEAERGIAND